MLELLSAFLDKYSIDAAFGVTKPTLLNSTQSKVISKVHILTIIECYYISIAHKISICKSHLSHPQAPYAHWDNSVL